MDDNTINMDLSFKLELRFLRTTRLVLVGLFIQLRYQVIRILEVNERKDDQVKIGINEDDKEEVEKEA